MSENRIKLLGLLIAGVSCFVGLLTYFRPAPDVTKYSNRGKVKVTSQFYPSVQLTSPSDNSTVRVGDTVSLIAKAYETSEFVVSNVGALPTKITIAVGTNDPEPKILPASVTETAVQGERKFIKVALPIPPDSQALLQFPGELPKDCLTVSTEEGEFAVVDTSGYGRKISKVEFFIGSTLIGTSKVGSDGQASFDWK